MPVDVLAAALVTKAMVARFISFIPFIPSIPAAAAAAAAAAAVPLLRNGVLPNGSVMDSNACRTCGAMVCCCCCDSCSCVANDACAAAAAAAIAQLIGDVAVCKGFEEAPVDCATSAASVDAGVAVAARWRAPALEATDGNDPPK